jgi:hypothetical protein
MEDKRQEDQDMMYVLQMIKKLFLNIFKSIAWVFEVSLKHILFLLLFVLICVGAGVGIYFMQTPYYKSEMFISNKRLQNEYCAGMIYSLSQNLDEGGSNASVSLAKTLKMDVSEAKKLKSIQYLDANKNIAKKYEDSAAVYLPFKVEVEVYDNSVLPRLQTSILNYLESNEYAQKLKEIESQSIAKTEVRILEEIKEIDSLKRIVNSSILPRGTGNGVIVGEPVNPVSIYDKAMKSYQQLMDLNKQKNLNNSFEVIVGFSENNKEQKLSLPGHIVYGIIIGYLLGLISLIARSAKSNS